MRDVDATHFLLRISIQWEKVPEPNAYPYTLGCVKNLGSLEFHPRVTFLVGENGTGKSTLAEAIAVGLGMNPEGGSKNFNFATRESHSSLFRALRIVRSVRLPRDMFFLRAESFFNLGTEIERLDESPHGGEILDHFGGVPIHGQSHGESFWNLFLNRFGRGGIYILDEPEAALSPRRQLGLLSVLRTLSNSGSQFIIATHSPILMLYPDCTVYELSDDGIAQTEADRTEHYLITRSFLNEPQKVLDILLPESEES